MKHKKRVETQNLVSGIIGGLGILALIVLVLSVTNGLISFGWFVVGLIITGVVLSLDMNYIERHFVDGEWT